MTTIEVPCPTCAATGESTHEDRHAGTNMDTCRTCGGRRTIPARPGESRETSWPFAVTGAPQPPSSTPGKVERLVDVLIEAARSRGAKGMACAMQLPSACAQAAEAVVRVEAARTALLSHISTAGRGEGAESRDAGRALKDALFACLKEGGADRQYGGVLTEGGKYAWVRFTREAPAADATNPQDQE